ncbi:protein N-terminal asparagine amidohydrolase-like [Haliotis rubra]|uniref:protein N-terminal asparagine amidohydrolase-like n=1 Tax=Haliotis rubra TaxID=36100 RepID=UPI001EE51357|nr:protein N-terminal asparagine amidohydrolase-like [Haliotis rubra]
MPLLVGEHLVEDDVTSIDAFLNKFCNLKASSKLLCNQTTCSVGPNELLYVGQREIGGTSPSDDVISVLGSEDATTCHIVVLQHSGSRASCIGHFDGCNSKQGLENMLELVLKLSKDKPEGQLNLHLIGGFEDVKGLSHPLSLELLNTLRLFRENIHLQTACIAEINTRQVNGVPFPVVYGVGVDIKSGEIYKATFLDKGPDLPLRGARTFTGTKEMMIIYDPMTQLMSIEPFSYQQMSNMDYWCNATDHTIRQNLSTSPDQEPKNFAIHVRECLQQIRDHPHPLLTMFKNGKPRCYKKDVSGIWTFIC